ncbi:MULTISPECIES: IclR family transcriptional regulator [Streptomyces]|uniref:IclR family transcriptional regulator n=1 Tax=Streptomyces TaxID=1883 RepID=UPI001C2F13DD|nr:IclR family transcriptional regulator [Streptomyces sp. GbtcB7]
MRNSEEAEQAPQYPIETVDKALRLLLLFRDRNQLRLTEAYEELGIGKSRAHRLLAMLVYHRFAVQDPETRVYRPGPALMEIGLTAATRMDIRALARPILEELASVTGETVHLGTLEGGEVRFLDCVESELALRVAGRVGRVLPAYATSLGKVMLAQLPTDTVLRLYPSESLAPVTPHTIRRRSELLAELDRVRERGYAVNHDESEEGVSSVGVWVPRGGNHPPAALSVAAPTARLGEQQVVRAAELMRDRAARIH